MRSIGYRNVDCTGYKVIEDESLLYKQCHPFVSSYHSEYHLSRVQSTVVRLPHYTGVDDSFRQQLIEGGTP